MSTPGNFKLRRSPDTEMNRLVNAFAYWQGQPIENATATYFDDIMQAFNRIQSTSGSIDGIELWNGETGWPTDGTPSSTP